MCALVPSPSSPARALGEIFSIWDASQQELNSALDRWRLEWQPAFPHISWPEWKQTFLRVLPDLEQQADGVVVAAGSLVRLARYLTQVLTLPEAPAASPDALTIYLAEKIYHYTLVCQATVDWCLPPKDCDIYRLLVAGGAGNERAIQVCHHLDWLSSLPSGPQIPIPGSEAAPSPHNLP